MRGILFILCVLGFLSSCVTREACNRKFPPQIKDSIRIKDSFVLKEKEIIRYKDTTIYTPVDSSVIKAQVICVDGKPKMASVSTKGKQTKHSLDLKDGILTSNCKCDSVAIQAKIKEQYNTTSQLLERERNDTKKLEQIVEITSSENKWLFWLGIFVGTLVTSIFNRFLKKWVI